MVLLLIGTFVLVWSMNRHLRKLPESFDRDDPEDPDADRPTGSTARSGTDPDVTTENPADGTNVSRADVPASNTLAAATSPYLRQHADNPVHWQQWTADALALAAERDVPILLSIGYAACHWCHVMAHESFEDAEVAAAMNANFVCIKVDREERPDLDAVYMNATVALTGQGGWPMTCFLTPDGRPFFCGTYYPKPSFLELLAAVSDTWRTRRAEVEETSDNIAGELRSMASGLPGGGPPVQAEVCDDAVAAVLRDEDAANGGFGAAPKFPPSALLEALLRNHERTGAAGTADDRRACRARRWRAAASTTNWPAGSPATASTRPGWCRTSRRCSTTTPSCCAVYAHWARRTRRSVGAQDH